MSVRRGLLLRRRVFSSSPSPSPNPSPETERRHRVKTIINRLFKIRDPDALVAAFNSTSSVHPRFRAAHNIYSASVRRLAAAGRPDAVRALLDHQKQFPDIHREGFALRLLSLYGAAGLPEDAAVTFRQLPSLGCPRSVKSFNALLSACAESKSFDLMADLFQQLPDEDPSITPNRFSYNILIQAFCQKFDFDTAFKTMELMETNGFAPDLISFNTMLNGLYSNGRIDDAEKVWILMAEKKIEPDTKSFNAKLRWLVSKGRVSDAGEVFDEMRKKGLKPDGYSFNALIKGYCEGGKLEEAKQIYMESVLNDCAPIRQIFEVLVPKLCEIGDIDFALKMCNHCLEKNCFIDVEVLQGVVNGLVKESREEEAKKLVELARKKGCSRKNLRMPAHE